MKQCLHNTQKRIGIMSIAIRGIDCAVMWCLYCGALKLGSDEWKLPAKPEEESKDSESKKEQDVEPNPINEGAKRIFGAGF